MPFPSFAERIAESLGGGETRVEKITDLGSSHSWTLHRASLSDGRDVFVKAAQNQPGVFAAEAAGLRWLASPGDAWSEDGWGEDAWSEDGWTGDGWTGDGRGWDGHTREGRGEEGRNADARRGGGPRGGSVLGRAPVPEVLAADDKMLILPWLPQGTPSARAAERFGRELAAMHQAGRPAAYGAPWEGFIADLPLDNTPSRGDWPVWYAQRRLEPFLRRAAVHLGTGDRRLIERVIDEIGTLAGPPEPPSRIHGDLWSGNVLWTEHGRAVVIDPAAHGGHRETDLAMLDLFGAPQLDRVLAAYDEASPLADGWRERVPLHQLHPLLVHVALFGTAYRARAIEAARAALSAAK